MCIRDRILTDNVWEFSIPEDIEYNYKTGERLIKIFYTESYSSWQKGGIERNHEFIRYIIPKGITFDYLTKKNAIDTVSYTHLFWIFSYAFPVNRW